jgi:hypothetical protein
LDYLQAIDWDNYVLDLYGILEFFEYFGIDSSTFDQDAWAYVQEEMGVVSLPYDVNYIIDLLYRVGYDAGNVNETHMLQLLTDLDWDNYVLDNYMLDGFFEELGIDKSTFNDTWEEIKMYELDIAYLPYEVNYIIDLLYYVGYNETLNQTMMFEFLYEVNWDNFVLDNYAMEEFLEYMGIDSSTFDQTLWEEVKASELGIHDMPYEVNYIINLLYYLDYGEAGNLDQNEMYAWLYSIDYDNFVLDKTALEDFFEAFSIDYTQFDPELYANVLSELEIIELPIDVHYVLGLLEYVGYDTSTVNQTLMQELLTDLDWDDYVLDNYMLDGFFEALGIDKSTFNQTAWEEVKMSELGIEDLPYEVNWIIDILAYVGYTEPLNHTMMFEYLYEVDWDNFVLDNYAMEEFLAYMGINSTTFDQTLWEEVKLYELDIHDMPYEVNYIINLLYYLDYGEAGNLDQNEMYAWLNSIDYDNFVLDKTALEDFFEAFSIDYTQFDPELYANVLSELEIMNLPYDVHYILDLLTYVGYDIDMIDQPSMLMYLESIDWDNFVLDNYALESFFIEMGIDYTSFNETAWEEVKNEDLGIADLPYEVNYILDLLSYVGFDVSTIDNNLMFELLESTDWTNFVLDKFALEEFFVSLEVDSSTFN